MFNAELAIKQLAGNAGRLVAMIGAKDFLKGDNFVSFKFKAKAKNKANMLKIKYDSASDTYNMEFIKVTNKQDPELKAMGIKVMVPTATQIENIEGVYCDQMKSIFEESTGLYVTL